MRWLADECIAAPLVAELRATGEDVLYVAELAAGLRDAEVAALALDQRRLLLTEDKDFGELVIRRQMSVPGLVLLRIGTANPAFALARLSRVIAHRGEMLYGRYTVIEEARIRVRNLQNI